MFYNSFNVVEFLKRFGKQSLIFGISNQSSPLFLKYENQKNMFYAILLT